MGQYIDGRFAEYVLIDIDGLILAHDLGDDEQEARALWQNHIIDEAIDTQTKPKGAVWNAPIDYTKADLVFVGQTIHIFVDRG